MLGAIVGDIVGSRFEWDNHRSTEFELFTSENFFTDDSIMSLAIAQALMQVRSQPGKPEADLHRLSQVVTERMQELGRRYPDGDYGARFSGWIHSANPEPYNSYGNGAAMRISPVAWLAQTETELEALVVAVTAVTHNHPAGIAGAQATALAIYLARHGATKSDIADRMSEFYNIDFRLDDIRDTYAFNETCQGTVPQAIVAFLESDSFESAIRLAISIGGDSDTLAAITGSIASAYYGIPEEIATQARSYLDAYLEQVLQDWEQWIGTQTD